jgi:hypothetical protein
LRTAKTFPFAQYEEFVVAIKNFVFYTKKTKVEPHFNEIIQALDVKGLENIITLFPKRHALSIRWWSLVQSAVASAPQLSLEKRIGADFLLKFLREVLHALLFLFFEYVLYSPVQVKADEQQPILNKETVAMLRPFLRQVVLELDLQCPYAFRTEALALSPPLEEADRVKIARLVGINAQQLPVRLPGRLGLC